MQRYRSSTSTSATVATAFRPFANHLLVPLRNTIKLVDLDDVVYFESQDKYSHVHTQSDDYLLRSTLGDLETRFAPGRFLRIHRRHLVNVRFIKELQRWGQRRLKLVMTVPVERELVVSRRSAGDVMSNLELCT